MSLHSRHHVHHFFKNKEMNELYLSYGIFNFALELISVFVPIYLYKIGYSIPWILFHFFITSLVFVLFSYTGARVVSRLGVKHTMIIVIPSFIIYFIGMHFIPAFPILFFILPALRAIKMILFNYSFHLNFIEHSDRQNRGKEAAAVQASALGASFLAPFFGGVIIALTSFSTLFFLGSTLLFLSIVPLFMSKENYEKVHFEKKSLFKGIFDKNNLPSTLSFAGYAIESWIGFIVWPLFLFAMLFNTESVGAITSLTTIMTFLIFYFIGKETDRHDKKRLMNIGTLLYFFGWIGRIFASSFSSILFIDTYKNLTQHILQVPWSAYSYDLAAKKNYFQFIVQREIVFNATRVIVIPILMFVFYNNFHPYAITFFIAALASLFYPALNKQA